MRTMLREEWGNQEALTGLNRAYRNKRDGINTTSRMP
jgi:hypothetical protein